MDRCRSSPTSQPGPSVSSPASATLTSLSFHLPFHLPEQASSYSCIIAFPRDVCVLNIPQVSVVLNMTQGYRVNLTEKICTMYLTSFRIHAHLCCTCACDRINPPPRFPQVSTQMSPFE